MKLLSEQGMQYIATESTSNISNAFFGRAKDIFTKTPLVALEILRPNPGHIAKFEIGREDYLTGTAQTKAHQIQTV